MISQITGKIVHLDERSVVLETGGIGYRVHALSTTLAGLQKEETATLATFLVVREDALDLYGFSLVQEKDFFELLIGISGIGPKAALNILNLAPLETLKEALLAGDSASLTKVSGIGKKTAEKLVLELRDKIVPEKISTRGEEGGRYSETSDVIEALESLGYSINEARGVLKDLPDEAKTSNEKIREALKLLGRHK